MSAGVPARAADFQAAWYFSVLVAAIVLTVVVGLVLGQRLLGPMWRDGERALAMLVGSVLAVTGTFFLLLFATAAIGLAPGTIAGGR